MSGFEAALNRLREERITVAEVRDQILKDEALRRADPAHRRQLLSQTMCELGELGRAISLLERVQDGDLVEMDLPEPAARPPAAPRLCGLVRRVQPMRARA